MARRRSRRSRSRRRSRLTLGRVALVAGIVLALLYFAFTRFFFDPFEEPARPFPLLVPRDVELFVRRERLESDISSFPRLREVDRLLQSSAWREMAGTTWFSGQEWPEEVAAFVDEVRQGLASAPLDVVREVLGSEVAVVGRDMAGDPRLALLARLSTAGKLAVDALHKVGGVLEQALPGSSHETRTDPDVPAVRYEVVTPAEGPPLFYARVSDLLVAANDETLLRDVLRVVQTGSELSVGLSRLWLDHLPVPTGPPASRFSTELAVDLGALLREAGLVSDEQAEAERGPDALANVLPKVLDPSLLEEAVGRLDLANGRLHLRLHAILDAARTTADRGGLLGRPAELLPGHLTGRLEMLPADIVGAVVINVDLRRFLRTLADGFDPELRRLLDQSLKNVQRYNATWPVDNSLALIDQLDAAFGGQLTVAVRALDHEVPPGAQPLPALAFILPVKDLGAWQQMETAFVNAAPALPIDAESMWQRDEGPGLRKWADMPGTPMEEISWIVLKEQYFVLSTDRDLVLDIVQASERERPSAADQPGARSLLAALEEPAGRAPGRANLSLYLDTQRLRRVLEPYAGWLGELETKTDLAVERARLQKEVVARDYPQWRGRLTEMPSREAAELEARLDELVMAGERERLATAVPAWAEAWRESWSWLAVLSDVVVALRWADGEADLELHLSTAVAP